MYLWKKKKKLLKAKQLNRAHMYSLQTQWMIFKLTYRTPTYNHLYPNHYHGNDQRSKHDLEEKKNRKKKRPYNTATGIKSKLDIFYNSLEYYYR